MEVSFFICRIYLNFSDIMRFWQILNLCIWHVNGRRVILLQLAVRFIVCQHIALSTLDFICDIAEASWRFKFIVFSLRLL